MYLANQVASQKCRQIGKISYTLNSSHCNGENKHYCFHGYILLAMVLSAFNKTNNRLINFDLNGLQQLFYYDLNFCQNKKQNFSIKKQNFSTMIIYNYFLSRNHKHERSRKHTIDVRILKAKDGWELRLWSFSQST